MMGYQVYVVSKNGKPLMATKRFGKVRRLLKSGRAKVICRKPFTIQLLYETTEYTQKLILGIDPGGRDIGWAVRKAGGELIEVGHMQTRSGEVSENMSTRQMYRRSRRRHRRQKRQRRAKSARRLFCSSDFRKSMVEKIAQEADPLVRYLKRNFPEQLRKRLDNDSQQQKVPAALKEEIAVALNEIIAKPLYDEERFAEVHLSERTRKLLAANPQSQRLVCLNRRLLEEAYPQEITKSPAGSQTTFSEGDKRKYLIAGTEKALVCKWIKPKLVRFNNRRRPKGWLTPTARHLLQTHINLIESIAKRLPLHQVIVEYGKFDIQKLDNPQIEGEMYQNGRKKGYANAPEYVLCRDRHTCCRCKKKQIELQVHHVIWESNGGAHTPENLLTLCGKCHRLVHEKPKIDAKIKQLFAGMRKRYVYTTLLNTIMPAFFKWLQGRFGEVGLTYGYETKEKRRELDLPKRHHVDAYLATLAEASQAKKINWDRVPVYEYQQFRRHHRQLINATRDRNYKEGKKIIAKNRRKRTGQKKDSLAELVEKRGVAILPRLHILSGKKVVRSAFKEFKKGDVVRYLNRVYVVKGYGENGRSLGLIGEKAYVPAKDCRLVTRNRGIVCL